MKVLNVNHSRFFLEPSTTFDDGLADLGVVFVDDLFVELPGRTFDEFGGLEIEALLAVDAEVLLSGSVLTATSTFNWSDRLGLSIADIFAMDASELVVGGVSEDRDVSASDVAPTSPAVMVFEVGLAHSLGSEIGSAGLAESGEVDLLVVGDARAFGGSSDGLPERFVGDVLGLGQLAPEGSIGVIGCGMLVEPSLEVGNAGDERDGALPHLPVDGDSEAVLVVRDVADGEFLHLTASGASVPCDGQERRVARVVRVVDHLQDLIPGDHVAGLGSGVVRGRQLRRDPGERVRRLVAFRDDAAERSEDAPESGVGFSVVVTVVDPADDPLGGLTIFEDEREFDVGQLVVVDAGRGASHHTRVLERFVARREGEVGRTQLHFIVELKEEGPVPVGELVARLDEFKERVEPALVPFGHASQATGSWEINLGVIAQIRKTAKLQVPNPATATGGVAA